MKKHLKSLVSLLIAVFVMSSISIIGAASEKVNSGTVSNSYHHYMKGDIDYSYAWEYYDNDTLVIQPSTTQIYINVNDLSDYMQTRFTSSTKITIDCSLISELYVFGDECPSSILTIVADDDFGGMELYDFHALNSVNIDIDFAPSEYTHHVYVALNCCAITTADIFEVEGFKLALDLYECYELTTLDVPEYVEYLYVFGGDKLTSITSTHDMAYLYTHYLYELKSVYVSGDIAWDLAINKSPSLETFVVTSDVHDIYLTDVNLSSVNVPNNNKFWIKSTSLTSATIDPERTIITYQMFYGCTNLTDVSIPDKVTTIYSRAFANCSSIESIVIPSNLNLICDDAFEGCTSLTDVYYSGNCEQFEQISVVDGYDAEKSSKKSIYEIFGNATFHFPDPTIVKQPKNYTGASGSTAEFTVEADGSKLKYQWQVQKNGTWTNCSINDGAKTATLTLEAKESRNGSKYRCVITDKFGKTVTSKTVKLTVDTTLAIISQPEDCTGTVGDYAVFNVVAQGDGLKYQWQYLKNGTWTNCSLNDGARTATFTQEIKDSRNGNVYHCVITDKNGKTVTSSEVTLTVDKSLEILVQPTDFSDAVGRNAMFVVEAKGEGLKYQWQVLKNGTWTNCSINDGARTNTLILLIKESRNNSVYHCIITDKYGNSVTTDEVALTVINYIYIAAEPEYCYGKTGDYATFTVEAEGDGLKYQWQVWKNGAWINCSINDGARTDTLKLLIKESRDGSKYQCVITDKYGNLATTREVILFVEIAEAKAVNPDFAVVEADAAVIEEATVETIESTDAVVTEDVAEVSEVFEVTEVTETEAITEAD